MVLSDINHLTDTTTLGYCEPGSNGNEGILHTDLQNCQMQFSEGGS